MSSQRIPEILVLSIALLFIAGYLIGHQGSISSTSAITPIPTTTRIPSPYDQPSRCWIKIDTVSDKEAGDVFTVNATTNLSTGESILFEVVPQTHYYEMLDSSRWYYSGDRQILNVTIGQKGINATSFTVNTSSYYPDLYYIYESAISENASDFIKLNITKNH